MQRATFQVNNLKLDAVIFYPLDKKDENPAILFVHGWTSEKKRSYQYAKSLSELGYICFLFDMRGHGQSEGNRMQMTNKDFLDDVTSAYDYLAQLKNIDKANISVVGSSFGGYLISLLTLKRRVKNLVLRAPADYKDDVFEKLKKESSGDDLEVMQWRKKIKNFDETYALRAINDFNGNILIMESELDDRVPRETLQSYINTARDRSKLTHVLLEGAPHSLKEGKFRDKVEDVLREWFKDKI